MAQKSTSRQPRRGLLLIGALGVAVVVAVALIVASQLSAGDEETADDRAAAVSAAAPDGAPAASAPAASTDGAGTQPGTASDAVASPDTTTGAGATTAASTLPHVEEVQTMLAGIPQQGTILGDPNAPVTIIEFADLRCPACRSWETGELQTLLDGAIKPGKARLDLQIISILGPDSDRAAAGAWAAEAQNRLWPFAMLWYYNQGNESDEYATDDYQRAIAVGAGLDVARFDADRADQATAAKAAKALDDARSVGFGGTPTFIVTGPGGAVPFLEGVPTAETLVEAVDQVSTAAGGS